MTTQIHQGTLVDQLAVLAPGMIYHDSLETMRHDRALLPYVAAVGRAWDGLGLTGVLFIDGRPTLYTKQIEGRQFQPAERLRLHRLFWNQGIANVLVLLDPDTAYIYSGLAAPLRAEDAHDEKRVLVEKLQHADYSQRVATLFHEIATGHYYGAHENWFSPDHSVDADLLDNLRSLDDKLTGGEEPLDTDTAHAFLGRILFLCYLIDRGIVSVCQAKPGRAPSAGLADYLEGLGAQAHRLDALYGLFTQLKGQFNGSMFDRDLSAEKDRLREAHLHSLILFLGGHEVRSGQGRFWSYDFRMIPVETISAIYESFLEKEDEAAKRKGGAFYTPRFLAEMVVDVCTEGRDIGAMRFLDPACGSGIFLVILFNRLASRWQLDHPDATYEQKAEALQTILRTQIRGVDKAETACRIACFSLYLAYLDCFDPPAIQSYIERLGKPLPKLLDYGGERGRPAADIPVIRKGDSLARVPLFAEPFDALIGNPPWEGRGSKQLAQAFLEQAPESLKPGATGCLLLPSKLLLNARTSGFQAGWLRSVTVEKVVQLADYSFLLFEHGKCPCTLVRFSTIRPRLDEHIVEFAAPKFSRATRRRGAIVVRPADRAWLPLRHLLAAADADSAPREWKRHLWGTPRDQKLLDLLLAMPTLGEQVDVLSELRKHGVKRTKRWCAGQGLKPWSLSKAEADADRSPVRLRWSPETRFLAATPWRSGLLALPTDTVALGRRLGAKKCRTDVLYSSPPDDLFRPPMILVSQGFGKVAFCGLPMLFQHSLQSIAGQEEDADLLMFLTVFLRSGLARYFLFHTAGDWGTERDRVLLEELLRLPFPVPGTEFVPAEHQAIIDEVAARVRDLRQEILSDVDTGKLLPGGSPDVKWQRRRAERTAAVQAELEPLVYRYFGITDQEVMLIEDTINVSIRSATPGCWDHFVPAQEPPARSKIPAYRAGLRPYADTLTATLNQWAEAQHSPHRVVAEGGTDDGTGLAMVTVRLADGVRPFRACKVAVELAGALQSYGRQVTRKEGTLEYPRDIVLFDGPTIHVVRPYMLANWTRTAALNDAARIYADIAQRRREGETRG